MKKHWLKGILSFLFCCEKQSAVADLAELALQDDQEFGHGDHLFVNTLRSLFLLDQKSSQPVDGITSVATLSGAGRWLRLPVPHPSWLKQATWFIDPAVGNDENEGRTDTSALKTHAELTRRWGTDHATVIGADSAVVPTLKLITVTLKGSLPPFDPINLKVTLGPNTLLAYLGTPTEVRSGSFTAVTVKNRATNTPWEVADADPGRTGFSAADVGKRVRITSGPRSGQFAWVAKVVGSGLVRMSSFSAPKMPGDPEVLFETELPNGEAAAGDPYVIEDMNQVTVLSIDVDSPLGGTKTNTTIGFANIDFRHTGGTLGAQPNVQGAVTGVFKGCRWDGQLTLFRQTFRHHYLNCQFATLGLNYSSPIFRGGLCLGLVAYRGGITMFNDDFMVQGGKGLLIQSSGALLGTVCVFDSVEDGFRIGTGDALPSNATCLSVPDTTPHHLWGAGNAKAGLAVSSGSLLSFQPLPPTVPPTVPPAVPFSVEGLQGDFVLAGATTSRAWDEPAGQYTAPIANTWVNFAEPIASGTGLGGNAHNVGLSAHLVER